MLQKKIRTMKSSPPVTLSVLEGVLLSPQISIRDLSCLWRILRIIALSLRYVQKQNSDRHSLRILSVMRVGREPVAVQPAQVLVSTQTVSWCQVRLTSGVCGCGGVTSSWLLRTMIIPSVTVRRSVHSPKCSFNRL